MEVIASASLLVAIGGFAAALLMFINERGKQPSALRRLAALSEGAGEAKPTKKESGAWQRVLGIAVVALFISFAAKPKTDGLLRNGENVVAPSVVASTADATATSPSPATAGSRSSGAPGQTSAKAETSPAPVASSSTSPQQATSQAPAKPSPPDYRPAYLAFRAKVHEPGETCSAAFRRMAGVLSGSKSEVDLYRAATEAKKVCREASWEFKKVDIPSSWPAQMRKDFKNVLEGMELAHIYKSEAAEAMMAYIDDKKISNSAKFQEKADEANVMMTGAMAKMVVTAQSFGISTD